jgi:DNA-directed RNA polymerase specialized sigma24 family protein
LLIETTYLSNQEGFDGENLSDEQRDNLMEGLMYLPPLHAQIILLYYFEEVSLPEIAKRLELELAVVDQMHFDALVRLKKKKK